MQCNLKLLLLLGLLVNSSSVTAELDALQSSLLKPYDRALRWDSLIGQSEWISGVKPQFEKALQQNTITLDKGSWTEVRVEKNSMLRIVLITPLKTEGATLDSLLVMRSNGTGLYVEADHQRTPDNNQMLLHNHGISPSTFRIYNTGLAQQKVAIYASRNTDLGVLAPYRQQIDLSPTVKFVELKIENQASSQQYWHLFAAHPIVREVTGPLRLKLEGRMIYPETESARAQRWQTTFWLDDQLHHTSSTESNVETLQTVFVNDKSTLVSRQEQIFIEIPAGRHMLRIQTSVSMYARLMQQDSTDYLFPSLNQPLKTAEVARNIINAQNKSKDLWELTNKQLKHVSEKSANTNISNTDLPVTEVEKTAQRLAMDNQWRDGGSVGSALMIAAASESPEDTALSRRSETFAGAHTFFRDILPNQKVAGTDMEFKWYRIPHLFALAKEDRNLVHSAQHTDQLVKQLGSGFFMPLPNTLEANSVTGISIGSKPVLSAKMNERIYFEGFSDKLIPAAKKELMKLAVLQFSTELGVKGAVFHSIVQGVNNPVLKDNFQHKPDRHLQLTYSLQTELPPGAETKKKASYYLPQRFAPGVLRIAAYSKNAADFFIQIDEQTPQRMYMDLSNRLPSEQFSPTAADAGLLLLAQQKDLLVKGDVVTEGDNKQGGKSPQQIDRPISTQSAAFARIQTPAPMVTVGVIEIPLSSSAKVVQLWRESAADSGLLVAVQYSADKGFDLSEQDFLSIYDIANDPGKSLRTHLRNHKKNVLTQDGIAQNNLLLSAQWRPLLRLINSERNTLYATTIAHQPLATLTSKAVEKEIAAAKAAESNSLWLQALNNWTYVFYRGNSVKTRTEAQWGRIHALHQLGEDFAFEQMLKQIFLYDDNQSDRVHALQMLDQHYRSSDDEDSLLRLYTIAVCQSEDMQNWIQLTTHLLNKGEYKLALLAGLALPPAQRPSELLLRATWKLGMWNTFEQIRLQLKSPERQAFWAAMHALAFGQHSQALIYLKQNKIESPTNNASFVEYLQQGLEIKQTFDVSAVNNSFLPKKSVEKWLAWQAEAPGIKVWRDAPELVKDFAGSLPGYAVDRSLHFSYYRATADRPLKIEITAPAKLRLEVRPIHASTSALPLEGWISALSESGQSFRSKWIAPIIANQATNGLTMSDGTVMGRKIMLELPLTMTGRQIITVDAGLIPVAVKVEVEQPEMPLGIVQVPTMNISTNNGKYDIPVEHVTFKQVNSEKMSSLVCNSCITLHNTKQDLTQKKPQPQPAKSINYLLNKIGIDQNFTRFRILEISSAKAELPQISYETVNSLNLPFTSLAQQLADGQYALILNNISINKTDAITARRIMTALLWIAEHDDTLYGRALAAGEALANNNKNVTDIDRMLGRLNQNSRWTAVEAIDESAGIRMIPISGWQPENPAARLQKALLPPFGNDEQIIGGNSKLVLTLVNTNNSTIDIKLSAEDLSLQTPQKMEVVMQRKGFPDEILTLEPNDIPHQLSLRLASGRQAIRFFIRNALTHQLLRLRFRERNGEPIANTLERMYHVATHNEPIRLQVSGPAWLRIDALKNSDIQSRYQYLPKSVQTVELKPEAGMDEELYRLHLRLQQPPQPTVQQRYTKTVSSPVPDPPVVINTIRNESLITFKDGFKLGGQEDGTRTFAVEPWLRFDADSNNSEQYLETSLTKRKFEANQNNYFFSQGLVRLRERGDAVLGAKIRIDHLPVNLPFVMFAEAEAYFQTLPRFSDNWSASVKAGINQQRFINPKTWHLPSFRVYANKVGKSDADSTGTIDQDIFTLYKSQHRWGYEVADQINYRPWLDTMLKASAGISSNENLITPDKMRIKFELQQQLGQWRADSHLSNNYYFKDTDRIKAVNIAELGISLNRNYWLKNQNRLELLLNINRRLDIGQNLGWFGLRWHFSNGRAYHDFRPGELQFDDLLKRDIDNSTNNYLIR